MAIIAPILAFVGRFVGKLVQMAFGWATVLLFGQVPQSKQLLLSGVALGSILWIAVVIGVILPDLGAVLITAVPAPDFVADDWIRLAMLVAALLLPLLIGVAGLFLLDAADRPTGLARVKQVLRGYPYAAVLALVLLFLIVVAPVRKLRTIVKRWDDAHIPVVVKPGGYERVGDDLEGTLDAAGLPIERATAPRILEMPSKLLAAVGGAGVRPLVPERLLVLRNRALEVTIYPTDVAMSGTKDQVARSRAAIASRLTFTAAYQTSAKEAQEIEDRLEIIATGEGLPWPALQEVDHRLARLVVEHEDWEVLYRKRLQVEKALRDRARSVEQENGGPVAFVVELIRRLVA
jgi:hypothetical protein